MRFGLHWGGILVLGIIVPLHLMGFCKSTAFAYAWPVPTGALGPPHTSLSRWFLGRYPAPTEGGASMSPRRHLFVIGSFSSKTKLECLGQ